jgi:hypothetical protein
MKWFVLRPSARPPTARSVGAVGDRAGRLITNGSEQIKWDASLAGIIIMSRE